MNKKKILIIGSIIAIMLSIALIIYVTTKPKDTPIDNQIEGITLPTNKNILKDVTINNLKITNISIMKRDNISTYKATVTNETQVDIKINKLHVIFYEGDNENKVLALSETTLAPNNKMYINITSENDLTKVTKINYVIE